MGVFGGFRAFIDELKHRYLGSDFMRIFEASLGQGRG